MEIRSVSSLTATTLCTVPVTCAVVRPLMTTATTITTITNTAKTLRQPTDGLIPFLDRASGVGGGLSDRSAEGDAGAGAPDITLALSISNCSGVSSPESR